MGVWLNYRLSSAVREVKRWVWLSWSERMGVLRPNKPKGLCVWQLVRQGWQTYILGEVCKLEARTNYWKADAEIRLLEHR